MPNKNLQYIDQDLFFFILFVNNLIFEEIKMNVYPNLVKFNTNSSFNYASNVKINKNVTFQGGIPIGKSKPLIQQSLEKQSFNLNNFINRKLEIQSVNKKPSIKEKIKEKQKIINKNKQEKVNTHNNKQTNVRS